MQNVANALSKMVFKISVFCQKAQNFVQFSSNFARTWFKYYVLVKFEPHRIVRTVQNSELFDKKPRFLKIMYGETSDFHQYLQRQHGRVLMENLLKNPFSNRTFYVTITDADIKSVKSLHTSFGKCLGSMLVKFEQNRMVENIF